MHPFAVLFCRLALGAVWLAAGATKLARRGRPGEAAAALGVPVRLAPAVDRSLPVLEVALGLLLLLGIWPGAAGAASALLLILFTTVILYHLARGHRVECHCFGELGRGRITWLTAARNLVLLAGAAVVFCSRSEYLTAGALLRGGVPLDPPLVEFTPVALIAAGSAAAWILGRSAWNVALAIGRAEGGPATGSIERAYLRRWLSAKGGSTGAAHKGR